MKNLELCIADLNRMSIYTFSNNMEEAEEDLKRAIMQNNEDIKTWEGHIKNYPDRESFKNYLTEAQNKKYEIVTFEEYLQKEKEYYINQPLTETTKEHFEEMLNVLPPLKWCTKHNVEMFCMSERLTGTYTSQYMYNLVNNKYYHKIVDILDEKTWGYNFI